MRKFTYSLSFVLFLTTFFLACQKNEEVSVKSEAIDPAILSQIKALGFSTDQIIRDGEDLIVEGDIVLKVQDLGRSAQQKLLRIAEVEQYHTTNLVSGPRTITVSIDPKLPASYATALDNALARYNAENLQLTFTRVSGTANISLVRGNGNFLASAGFPTASGEPHNQVKINSRAIGDGNSSAFINYVATIIAHELGHCIGFRHTDYMDRSYSCGGAATNEGASTVGAIHIPGTPTGPDANSWMLSCIGSGVNRPFNNNDRTALNYLY